ncbi:MAG: ATP-dependent DNA ligase [Candidatus Nanohaloarchaea archaeon]
MKYSRLVETYEKLEQTQATLEKTEILAELFEDAGDELDQVVLLSMGRAFPSWQDLDLGISSKTMVDIIKEASGKSEAEIENTWKEEGDLGSAAERILEGGGGQQSLMQKELTVGRVNEKLEKVARMEEESLGSVSMDKKKKEVAALLNDSTPREAKYIVRTFIENLRLGVGEGIVRDALAETFFDGENAEEIQRAYDLTNDFKEVARACRKGIEEIESLEIELFRPIKSMLAKKVESIEDGFEEVGKPAAVDYKYDGFRAQIHCREGEVKVFTRRLEDVTEQFPDVKEFVEAHVRADNFIIDAEVTAYDPEDGSTIPFQKLSRRVKRKYGIEEMKEKIPVEVRPFDLLYLDGSMIEESYQDRFSRLEEIVDEDEQELRLADRKVTRESEDVSVLQQQALDEGHEGIMMKNLDARYKPGSRVGYMVKLKPVMETLDLAIIGAKWGEGRRSNWLSRLKLGCYDEDSGEYRQTGKMATGLTDEQLEEVTERLKPLIIEEDGRDVKVRPEVIVEAEYEEIQESPTYDSGYALRFPRLKSFRDEKEEADSLEKVERLYEQQEKT